MSNLGNLSPQELEMLKLRMMGNDMDQGIYNDPEYQKNLIKQQNDMIRMKMRTPNSVVDPKTGEYLGEYEFMSLLSPGGTPFGQMNQNEINLGATPFPQLSTSELNLSRLLNQIKMLGG
jgi:hypothetical protein